MTVKSVEVSPLMTHWQLLGLEVRSFLILQCHYNLYSLVFSVLQPWVKACLRSSGTPYVFICSYCVFKVIKYIKSLTRLRARGILHTAFTPPPAIFQLLGVTFYFLFSFTSCLSHMDFPWCFYSAPTQWVSSESVSIWLAVGFWPGTAGL